ncbi:phosphonate ABC transporter, permease protein PhnE [Clostridiisalibacter paucivorans]|uniref:phosphonate ABC transporter, permease protein PhnE n=1 Tax=Clostridiisalibacter paucivorans TaxID=408753 RepID=UPI00047C7CDB|nr:phosphonate ABC transporter, permease protein PhnE [Clostridiisalibacter paucivorans]
MKEDMFSKRRNRFLLFGILLFLLTFGSILITEYEVVKGFTSVPKAIRWMFSSFYPNQASLGKLPSILEKLKDTINMSIAATTVSSCFALVLAILGSKTTRVNNLFSVISRFIASVFRNIPIVAWAMVLLFSFGQSDFTGYLALFFVTFGFLTRAFIETIDEASFSSVEALRATGASYFHIIFQAVFPSSIPQLISWILFMIETNIRSSTLIGILTGSGIGFSFNLYYKSMNYNAASLVVVCVVITVLIIELISNYVRRVIL